MTRRVGFVIATVVIISSTLPALAEEPTATEAVSGLNPNLTIATVEEDLSIRTIGSGAVLHKVRTLDVSENGLEALDFSLDLRALEAELRSSSLRATSAVAPAATTCYLATPTWRLYNGYGQLVHKTWYNIKWCSSGGKVTSVPSSTFWCDGTAGGGWQYMSCNVKSTTGTGSSYFGVSGSWTFRFGAGGVYIHRYVTVAAKHYADGRYTGTWCANC